jgi:hypothetical protein
VSAACASLEECQGNTRLDCLRQRCEKWRRASGNADTERHGSDKAVLSPDTRNYIASLVAENADLRQFLCDVAKALNNGSGASPQCSMQFLSWISGEVSAEVTKLRQDAERYRWLRRRGPQQDFASALWEDDMDAAIDAARKALSAKEPT